MAAVPFAAVLLAGLVTGMTGFGFSVLAVPLLVLVYDPHDVVLTVLCLVPVTSAALLLAPHLHGQVRLRLTGGLSLLSLLGLPLGVVLLQRYDPGLLVPLMGIVITAYAAFGLYSPDEWRLPASLVVPSGVLGGVLASSTGLSGPAVAMYVHGRRLAHDELVATMAAYVATVSLLGLAFLAVQGQLTATALSHVVPLIPCSLLGVALGRWWARRRHQSIERITLQALGLMGLWTLLRAIFG
jgi:uncharacterized membrane protein YfcA